MDFHVGSLANLIAQKTKSKISSSKLFQNLSSDSGKEVQFKVVPTAKRKRIPDEDEAAGYSKRGLDDGTGTSYRPKVKRLKYDNARNAAKRLHDGKPKLKEKVVNPEEDSRTIFVGNLPCNIKVLKLKKLFKPYGEIESARLRCPPLKDPKIPKRVAAIKKDFHPERTSIVGYVRFSSEEEATAALQAHGLLYKDHHLRVDRASGSRAHDQKKAVFVGNVPFGAEENDLWEVFAHCGEIDSIRIVRDSQTGVGKGFAYVNFKDLSSVQLALKLDGEELKERALRVKRAVKKLKVKKDSPKAGRKGLGQKFKGVRKAKFANKKQFRKDDDFEGERGSVHKTGKKFEEAKFKRGGAGKKLFWDDKNKLEEEGGNVQKAKKKLKMKIKPVAEKSKSKLTTTPSEEEPAFQGKTMDEKSKGKVKKKKLSKTELKKKVLAFQLQLKKSGISNQ